MTNDLRSIERAAYDLVHDNGASQLAALLHKSPTTLCHEVSDTYDTAKFGALDAVRLMRHTKDYRLLYAIGDACGHRVVPETAVSGLANEALINQFAKLAAESGDVFRSFHSAIADGRITLAEVDTFEHELWEMLRVGMSVATLMREQATADRLRVVPSGVRASGVYA